MRKLLALAITLMLTVLLFGCGEKTLSTANQSQQVIEQQAVTEEVVNQTEPETIAETVSQTSADEENIGEEKAKQIALEHAGLKESDVKHLFVELDFDDGILRYEVDFRQGKFKYDYDIDAKTGEILSYDKDIDD